MRRIRNLANGRWYLGLILLIGILAAACGDEATATRTAAPPTATIAPTATATIAPTATATGAPTATVAVTAVPTEEVMLPKGAILETVLNPNLGVTMLVDGGGLTVYLFTEDESGSSNCSGGCANFWPPLLTEGDPTAGEGVSADQLGSTEREDGSIQVTYNGWPLYYFVNDAGPGETNGQDISDS